MTLYYSPTTGGFYDTDFAEYSLPQDSREITQEEHQELLLAQSSGKEIQADPDGNPVAVECPVDLPMVAQGILDENDRMALRLWKDGGSWPSEWQAYDEALRDVRRGKTLELPTPPTKKPWEA